MKLGQFHGLLVGMQWRSGLHLIPGIEPSPDLRQIVPVIRKINHYSMITKDFALIQGVGLFLSTTQAQLLQELIIKS